VHQLCSHHAAYKVTVTISSEVLGLIGHFIQVKTLLSAGYISQ